MGNFLLVSTCFAFCQLGIFFLLTKYWRKCLCFFLRIKEDKFKRANKCDFYLFQEMAQLEPDNSKCWIYLLKQHFWMGRGLMSAFSHSCCVSLCQAGDLEELKHCPNFYQAWWTFLLEMLVTFLASLDLIFTLSTDSPVQDFSNHRITA